MSCFSFRFIFLADLFFTFDNTLFEGEFAINSVRTFDHCDDSHWLLNSPVAFMPLAWQNN